jgi:hypothetical protein
MKGKGLLDVPGDQLGHFEHADLFLSVENSLKSGIGVDQGLLFGVLKFVRLDVVPKLLGELSPRQGLGTDNGSEHGIGLDGLHQGGIRFTGSFFGFRHGGASKRWDGCKATEKGKFSGVVPACKRNEKVLAADFEKVLLGAQIEGMVGRHAGGESAFPKRVAGQELEGGSGL